MDDRVQKNIDFTRLLHEQQERLKELACINRTTSIIREGKPVDETLHQIALILPAAWQYPDFTVARISFNGTEFSTAGYRDTSWKMSQEFNTIDDETGLIEVCYTKKFDDGDEGPFLKEERDLIRNIANLIAGYLNGSKAKKIIKPLSAETEIITGGKLLQQFIDRHNAERDVFHDLMPFRVREVLFIANLYDAYSIEGEGRFSDFLAGEYHEMNLATVPRLTGVSDEEEAFSRLRTRHYDLVIIMVGVEKESKLELCRKIRHKYPYITTYLLLTNADDVPYVKQQRKKGLMFDNFFVWTGDSKVFFAMVNLLEDSVNADNDTRKGLIRIILLVEDSVRFYSYYLPVLYSLVMEQTKSLIDDVSSDELYKILKLKARPKILLASDYEGAKAIYERYRDNLLCIISDMRFPKNGIKTDMAGYDLITEIKKDLPALPALLQSSDPDNSKHAYSLKASFLNKNSGTLLQDLKSFINYYLGFGHFIYRDKKGGQIAVAKSMKEFEEILQTVPEDSLRYHAMRNHFSLWLMARGEVKIAKYISPMTISDFESLQEMREFLIDLIRQRRKEMNRGKVVSFEETAIEDDANVISLGTGSLGGKGRGLAFVNTLIHGFGIGKIIPSINIKTPLTAIIGTDEFDIFMDRNHLRDKTRSVRDFSVLKRLFAESSLSYSLEKKLRILIRELTVPVAVRSSSLLEDSTTQPFSGIFGTYLLPNNHRSEEVRYQQLSKAIKLVYCSIYSESSRIYFDATRFNIEHEKMAVVIQPVVGNRFRNVFYPHISGTAQSFNFYPVSHMKPEDGVAVTAVGLGQYVVEGENAFRFCPSYPAIDIVSQEDMFRDSQVKFYAVDMSENEPDLLQGENAALVLLDINEAEKHGTLDHCASVLNPDNDSITTGLGKAGPRIINFADILKYGYIPLSATLKLVLDVVAEAIGTAVEIEFAVDLSKDEKGNASFYILQIKPLVGTSSGYTIDTDTIGENELILFSEKSMGNGLIDDLSDIIYAEPEKFSGRHSRDMAAEVAGFNETMKLENRKYVLIGPGRWGTRDTMAGIPVRWPEISNARVIAEVNLPGSHLDASLGSHFFHNVTSMNIGYFSINQGSSRSRVDWKKLAAAKTVKKGRFFTHVRFEEKLVIRMDGKKGISVISMNK